MPSKARSRPCGRGEISSEISAERPCHQALSHGCCPTPLPTQWPSRGAGGDKEAARSNRAGRIAEQCWGIREEPSFLNARKRSEQALLGVVMEAYTNGVSTRKVERLVEQLGVESMSKSQVSRICALTVWSTGCFRASACSVGVG